MLRRLPSSTLFPYTTLFRSHSSPVIAGGRVYIGTNNENPRDPKRLGDRGVLMCFEEKTGRFLWRSEEHTSELQSHSDLVCRLLLEKKKKEKRIKDYQLIAIL